jgi:hypothetical protein
MVDYYALIARAVSRLPSNSSEARQTLYERALTALVGRLRENDPPISESEIERERLALEAAIRKVEEDASLSQIPDLSAAALLNKDGVSADGLPRIAQVAQTEADHTLPPSLSLMGEGSQPERAPHPSDRRKKRIAHSIGNFGKALLGIACFVAAAVVGVVFVKGLAWFSYHIFDYFVLATQVTLMLGLFILLPLAFFRSTRIVSVYGFLISSHLLGLTTWILGFLTTLEYWGTIAVLIGLGLGIVGIVPLGMMASAFHADWWSLSAIVLGLFMTYGARDLAFNLAASLE